ncbi:DNA repair protein RadC [Saprospiraceae bacterium]|jgi:DNA repair protein RadC|nr:DNA repair protein RadC [Bacteroidota bacterium]MDB4727511.1 DNA repair protein RadC [Saprospiraceae bacterium]MDF1866982.1 DNA repair protein RadC [Saprospiraceae bacterium]
MKNNSETTFPITLWAEEDRPREKLQIKGKQSLSDAELLAILLGSGSREETAVGLSKLILKGSGNNLYELGKRTTAELKKFKGVGEAKAITIVAAMELARRRQLSNILEKPKIVSSRDAFNLIAPILVDLPHEEFWILMLNRGNKVIGREKISIGGMASTIVDSKIVFRKAIEKQSTSIILCHNHPSGNLSPSQADIDLTQKLKKGGAIMEIPVIDHLIISDRGYYSFADEGIL